MLQRRIKLGICWGERRERNVSKASLRRYLEQNHRKPGDVGRPGSSPGEEGPGEVQKEVGLGVGKEIVRDQE